MVKGEFNIKLKSNKNIIVSLNRDISYSEEHVHKNICNTIRNMLYLKI